MEYADVVVVGAGHAGCEAALACARMGLHTLIFAISMDSVAMMPCNPNIGGNSKGHLVKEIDALGGEMGRNIDKAFIQSRMLNVSKGPAVYSLRAQADKRRYSHEMKKVLENTDMLELKQGEVTEILTDGSTVAGVVSESGIVYNCRAVVLTTGTYLNARCLYGDTIIPGGPNGLRGSYKLTSCLEKLGIEFYRFKTGTPARVDRRSLDFSKLELQPGDERVVPFSFENDANELAREQIPCYLTYTNEATHAVIRENLHRSPMYSGVIEGTGTRYCPSIEDKIVRFPDKERHQIFIEPEGEDTNEMYIQGMSSSLPEDVQIRMYRTVPGMENCRIIRAAYAIEYSCIDATQLKLNLEFKNIHGLFSGGQLNGSSGYEEAAAQGLVAGVNAACYVNGREPFIIDRSQGYIGVLVDDLVTKGTREPYRMMTSRAEYRLLLRQDNADLRLTPMGYEVGLATEGRYNKLLYKKELIERELKRVENTIVSPNTYVNDFLLRRGSSSLISGVRLNELVKRPELDYNVLAEVDNDRPELPEAVAEQVNIIIKYEGYIKRQLQQVAQFKKMEGRGLSGDIDYSSVKGLRLEAQQKLAKIRPANIGQASRITGVSPADISVLLVNLMRSQS